MAILLQSGFIGTLLTVCACIQWSTSPKDGAAIYACVEGDVTIPWAYNTTVGEGVNSVEWFFSGPSSEMMAVYTHNNFLVLPSFSKRVIRVGSAGIKLSGVSKGDSGNYTVEMNGFTNGSTFTVRRTVILQVVDDLQTTDGHLHVSENPQAVMNPSTGKATIELRCGTFTYRSKPPFDVEWELPSGAVFNSTDYKDNQFCLLLPNPVATGNYTCRIPHDSAHTACIHDTSRDKTENTLILDGVEIRLALLESQQAALQKENAELKQETTNQQTAILKLVTSNMNLSERVQFLEGRENSQVVFYAHGFNSGGDLVFNSGNPMVMSQVPVNEANAYSSTTGIFTVPLDGFYFFAGASGSGSSGHIAFYLSVDGQSMGSFAVTTDPGGGESVSVQLVAHLRKNQRVYLAPYHGGQAYMNAYSYFSGFLISHD